VVFTEQGVGWVRSTLQMLDGYWMAMRAGRVGEFKADENLLPLSPTDYFQRNVWVGASFPSPSEAKAMRKIGLEKCMWGSDYPHHEGCPPYSREAMRRAFEGWTVDEIDQVLTRTATEVYGFDPAALASVAARIGPTVDEIAVPLDEIPKDSGSPAFYRP